MRGIFCPFFGLGIDIISLPATVNEVLKFYRKIELGFEIHMSHNVV